MSRLFEIESANWTRLRTSSEAMKMGMLMTEAADIIMPMAFDNEDTVEEILVKARENALADHKASLKTNYEMETLR
jgi:hypothetical protein